MTVDNTAVLFEVLTKTLPLNSPIAIGGQNFWVGPVFLRPDQPKILCSKLPIFMGKFNGNVPNHENIPTSDFVRPVKGEVCLYITNQYPFQINFDALRGDLVTLLYSKVISQQLYCFTPEYDC